MVIPFLLSAWNLIICRTFLQKSPNELYECARIDGCSEYRILWQIVFPTSKAILAVMALYYGVAQWNSWFPAILLLSKPKLRPIQLFLRRVVIENSPELISSRSSVSASKPAPSQSERDRSERSKTTVNSSGRMPSTSAVLTIGAKKK